MVGRQKQIFAQFQRHAACIVEGARVFSSLVDAGANIPAIAARIKDLEHEADVIAHQCLDELHRALVVPVDRAAAYRLMTRMDAILDPLEAASDRIVLYELAVMEPEVASLAGAVLAACQQLQHALVDLPTPKRRTDVLGRCVAVNRIENQADAVLGAALACLLNDRERDPIVVIKWKEVFEILESATDRCGDAANAIERLVLEYG